MYESVYFHKTVRGASLLLTATLKRAAQAIDQTIPDINDPLRAVLINGQSVDLDRYLRATDATVWFHLDRWRDSEDLTLRHLASQLARRAFPRAIDFPALHNDGEKLRTKAIELAGRAIANVDPEYLVAIDEPTRLSYKRYTFGEGSNQSIQTIRRDGPPRPIETDDRSIVSKVAQKFYKRRLFVPVEIRAELLAFAKNERIRS